MIELIDVFKSYRKGKNKVSALNGISVRFEKGEMAAIVGPSGSGKSTLMNIIGCMDTVSCGKYLMEDTEVSSENLRDIRRRIGFIFQDFNLISNMDALKNVELPLKIARVKAKERRQKALSAMNAVGLSDRLHHLPYELSGGQRQRVAVARAIASNRDIIVADEPTGNLDEGSGKAVMEALKQLNTNGKTVLVVTHDIKLASSMPRVVRIENGRITEDTKTGETDQNEKTGQSKLLPGHRANSIGERDLPAQKCGGDNS